MKTSTKLIKKNKEKKQRLLNHLNIKYYMIKSGNNNKKLKDEINNIINKLEKL